MAQYELNLRDYYRIIRRHFLVVIAAGLSLGGITWRLSESTTSFRSSSTVRITQRSTITSLLLQTFSWSPADNIATQISLITSQPVLLEVAHARARERAKAGPDTTEYPVLMIPESVDRNEALEVEAFRRVLNGLAGSIRAQQVGSSSLVEIVATASDAGLARELARQAATAYEQYSIRTLRASNDTAMAYISKQIVAVRETLETAQQSLQRYRQDSPSTSIGEIAISSLVTRRMDFTDRLLSLQELSVRLRSTEETPITAGSSLSSDAAAPYQQVLADLGSLMQDRRRLLLTYTENAEPVRALDERIKDLRSRILGLVNADVALLREQISGLDLTIARYPQSSIDIAKLTRKVDLNTQILTQLETSQQEIQIQQSREPTEVQVVNLPTGADELGAGNQGAKTLIGLLLGLMLGVVLAFIVETMDTSIGTIEDVEEYLELSVLSVIPHLGVEKVAARLKEEKPELADDPNLSMYARLITQYDPKSPAAEAYRTLRTNLQFATAALTEDGVKKNTFVFSSASLQEGKSTTIVNLAITMAQAGSKVLMMGCNMRRPTIYKSFGLKKEHGMVDILTGNLPWRDCVKTVTDMMIGPLSLQSIMSIPGLDNLNIITSGGIPPNPSELLNSARFKNLIDEVRKEYDYVLVDCPPILPVTDAAIVSRQVDWAVLVYQVGKVPRNALRRAKSHLTNVGANVLGIAMNDVKAEISGYSPYSQYMTKYYGEETKKTATVLQRVRDFVRREKKAPWDEGKPAIEPSQAKDDEAWIGVDYYENGDTSTDNGLTTLPFSAARSTEKEPEPKETREYRLPQPDSGADERSAADISSDSGIHPAPRFWIWSLILLLLLILLFVLTGGFGLFEERISEGAPAKDLPASVQQPTGELPRKEAAQQDPSDVWAVRAGSFRTESEAMQQGEELTRRLGSSGAPIWVVSADAGDLGHWYRVYVGRFEDRPEADQLAARLKSRSLSAQPLVQHVSPPVP